MLPDPTRWACPRHTRVWVETNRPGSLGDTLCRELSQAHARAWPLQ